MVSDSAVSPSQRVLWGVGLVCFGNLLLEVLLTRIFSATMYYHFTFLAIALALFGMGASGVYVYIKSDRYTPERVADDLATNARRFAASTIVALMYILANPINLGVGMGKAPSLGKETILPLVLLNGVTALPFFFSGMVVSLAVLHYRKHIDRVYFYDLTGAAIAALLAGLLLGWFGAPSLVLAIAVLSVGAAMLFRAPTRVGDWVPAGLALLLLLANLAWPVIAVRSGKGVKNDRVVFQEWNAFSRVTVEKMKDKQLHITIDSSARTRMAHSRELKKTQYQREVSALAYSVHKRGTQNVLIIGPGGGPDVVNALAAGSVSVTGVEINPIIVDVMKRKFAKETGNLYKHRRVKIVTDEGRSFIRRTNQRYHVIQATLVDTWAATASGAFALTENTLYTLEAFEDYYRHLHPHGVVTMTRWLGGRDPEIARLLVLAAAGLTKLGIQVKDLRKHILLVRQGPVGTLLAKRTPFSAEQLARVEAASQRGGFKIILTPKHNKGHKHFQQLIDAGPYSQFIKDQRFDLTPPTDDRPFFFYFNRPGELFKWKNLTGEMMNPAVWILVAFGIAICALSLIFILVPLLVHRRDVWRGGGKLGFARRMVGLLHFSMIGLSFITIEIALMQKLGLFLGHPTYGLIVVLFAVLSATALGARLSGRIPDNRRAMFSACAAVGVALLALTYSVALDGLLRDWITMILPGRIAVATITVAIAGLMMGLVLPLGVRVLSDRDHEIIPWCWGINGATSVIGTVLATILAIHLGFNATLRLGAMGYIVAGLAILGFARLGSVGEDSDADAEPQ